MGVRTWDLFCRVVDNFGDIGFCWRLAAELASRGEQVRLRTDDASALAWMAPAGAAGVSVIDWSAPDPPLGDVVVEAFGCDPPEAFLRSMAALPRPPCWIDLEHLSAETYVERNHRLRSPQSVGAAAGLVRHFFYPGFTERTGGLLRETGLAARRQRFDASAWLRSQRLERATGEQIVSLFCYDQLALPALLDTLAGRPTLLLATPGHAASQVERLLGASLRRGALRTHLLPRLSQVDYDHLLWASDLNFVRGEDSFVRAQWAGVPFVWQIYSQQDGAHAVKLQAFIDLFLTGAEPRWAIDARRLWSAWNGLAGGAIDGLPVPADPAWRSHCAAWRDGLWRQADLVEQLIRFVDGAG